MSLAKGCDAYWSRAAALFLCGPLDEVLTAKMPRRLPTLTTRLPCGQPSAAGGLAHMPTRAGTPMGPSGVDMWHKAWACEGRAAALPLAHPFPRGVARRLG